jgi:ABC-2 type transport system permease protein
LGLLSERVLALAWKDAVDFLRDRRSIGLMIVSAFLFPLLGLMVTGLKAQQAAPVAVVACDRGAAAEEVARLIAEALRKAGSFNVTLANDSSCGPRGGAAATIVVPAGFTANITSLNRTAVILVYKAIGNPAADDAEAIVDNAVRLYARKVAEKRVEVLAEKAGIRVAPGAVLEPLRVSSRGVTPTGQPASPEEAARASVARFLAFSVFFVLNPAALAVADSVSRERESGTGEILATTPLSGLEFVAGKAAGSLAAALVAGSVDLAAAFAYAFLTGFQGADPALAAVHAAETVLAIIVTMAFTVLATLLVPGQRAATLVTSMVTGLAVMVFFSVLFVDIDALPPLVRLLLYLVPYTHTAVAIEAYALGEAWRTLLHTLILVAAAAVSLAAAGAVYRPDRLVKRQ